MPVNIFRPYEEIKEAWARSAYSRLKHRAFKKGIPFGPLTLSDIPTPDTCPALLIPLNYYPGFGLAHDSPSIDRKDPRYGYSASNIWTISLQANSLKRNLSYEQFLELLHHWREVRRKNWE